MSDVSIFFEPFDVRIRVPSGSLLLDAARLAGIAMDAPCGGSGRCGRCRVTVAGATSPITEDERALLSAEDISAGVRLACRARALGDVTVTASPSLGPVRVVERSVLPRPEVELPSARGIQGREGALLGAAVDIGTTTLVATLVDLRNGDRIATASALNPQRAWGADVVSRLSAAQRDQDVLKKAIVSAIGDIVAGAAASVGVQVSDVCEISVVGNTAMRALLLGEDVAPLASAPYTGAPVHGVATTGGRLGLEGLDAPVYVAPGISAFVGGDVVAGLVATQLTSVKAPSVFIDLGTNGEVVLVTPDGMRATSAAAGPALEGAGIEMGMRAEEGAIESAWLENDELHVGVIGDVEARGICGSGLLDLTAVLLDSGTLDVSGRLQPSAPSRLAEQVVRRDEVTEFRLDLQGRVRLTQKDIRELQLAKGAIATALKMLLASEGVDSSAIESVVIAGGFGYHVRSSSLARLGVIPAHWQGRVTFVGNTAISGAEALLLSSDARVEAERIAHEVQVVELASDPAFGQSFLSALDFPES